MADIDIADLAAVMEKLPRSAQIVVEDDLGWKHARFHPA